MESSSCILPEAIAPLLLECSQSIIKGTHKEVVLELTLESVISLSAGTDAQLLPNLLALLKGVSSKVKENSSLLFTSELCCQACIQIIDHNQATNAHALRVNKITDQVSALLRQCSKVLHECANELVNLREEDTSDPFN